MYFMDPVRKHTSFSMFRKSLDFHLYKEQADHRQLGRDRPCNGCTLHLTRCAVGVAGSVVTCLGSCREWQDSTGILQTLDQRMSQVVRHTDSAEHVAPRNQRSSIIKTKTRKPKTRGTTGAVSLIATPACTNKATIDGSTLPANFSNREVGQSLREAFATIARARAHDLAQNGSRVGPSLFVSRCGIPCGVPCAVLAQTLRASLQAMLHLVFVCRNQGQGIWDNPQMTAVPNDDPT